MPSLLLDHSTLIPGTFQVAGRKLPGARVSGAIATPGYSAGTYNPADTLPEAQKTAGGGIAYNAPRGKTNPYQNSYVSVAEAEEYFLGRLYTDEWGATDPPIAAAFDKNTSEGQAILAEIDAEVKSNEFLPQSEAPNVSPRDRSLLALLNVYDHWEETGKFKHLDQTFTAAETTIVVLKAARDALVTKQAVLIWATKLLDSEFRWSGYKQYQYQALKWPRYGTWEEDNYYVDQYLIPKSVKEAQCELALELLRSDRTQLEEPSYVGLTSLKVGSISLAFDKMDRPPIVKKYITKLVAPYVLPGLQVVRT